MSGDPPVLISDAQLDNLRIWTIANPNEEARACPQNLDCNRWIDGKLVITSKELAAVIDRLRRAEARATKAEADNVRWMNQCNELAQKDVAYRRAFNEGVEAAATLLDKRHENDGPGFRWLYQSLAGRVRALVRRAPDT